MKRGVIAAALLGALAGLYYWQGSQLAPVKVALERAGTRPALGSGADRAVSRHRPSDREQGRPVEESKPISQLSLDHEVCIQDAQEQPASEIGLVFYCSDTSAIQNPTPVRTDSQGCVQMKRCALAETVTCVRVVDPSLRRDGPWVLGSEATRSVFRLAVPTTVHGQIVDAQQEPIVGAELWFEPEDPDPMSPPVWAAGRLTSDAQGRFAWVAAQPVPCDPCVRDEQDCELARGDGGLLAPVPGNFWIRHPGYRLQKVAMPERWGSMPLVELVEGPSRVRGVLSGPGARGAKLFLEHQAHRLDRQVVQTMDARGRFEFLGLGEGLYDLSVFVEGRVVLRRAGVRAGEQLTLEF